MFWPNRFNGCNALTGLRLFFVLCISQICMGSPAKESKSALKAFPVSFKKLNLSVDQGKIIVKKSALSQFTQVRYEKVNFDPNFCAFSIESNRQENTLEIKVSKLDRARDTTTCQLNFDITLPKDAVVEIAGGNIDVSVFDLKKEIKISTGVGQINLVNTESISVDGGSLTLSGKNIGKNLVINGGKVVVDLSFDHPMDSAGLIEVSGGYVSGDIDLPQQTSFYAEGIQKYVGNKVLNPNEAQFVIKNSAGFSNLSIKESDAPKESVSVIETISDVNPKEEQKKYEIPIQQQNDLKEIAEETAMAFQPPSNDTASEPAMVTNSVVDGAQEDVEQPQPIQDKQGQGLEEVKIQEDSNSDTTEESAVLELIAPALSARP